VEWDQSCVDTANLICLPIGVCGLSTAGSCFAIHFNPACDDPNCCEQVCATDPSCCTAQWDSLCVQRALVNCGTPSGCATATGSCYEVHPSGGCVDAECCEIVCSIEPLCCNSAWDFFCVAAANCYCAGGCNVVCPGNATQELEVCGQKKNDPCYNPGASIQGQSIVPGLPMCGRLFVEELQGGAINADVDVFVAQLGAAGSGQITATLSLTSKKRAWAALIPAPPIGGCNPLTMSVADVWSKNTLVGTKQVCVPAGKYWVVVSAGIFPTIGQTETFPCADGRFLLSVAFVTGCDSPCQVSTESCFVPHSTPGCATPSGCCDLVCLLDPFCCVVEWDNACAIAASTSCGAPPPVNDACALATPVTVGTTLFSTILATTDGPPVPPECDKGVTAFKHDVWFSFQPKQPGQVRATTCGDTSFDTRLAVYRGASCPPSELIGCNDDDRECVPGPFSTVVFDAACNEVYLIRIGGLQNVQGIGTLTLEALDPGTCGCAGDLNDDGVVDGADIAIVLGNWGGAGDGDANDDGIVDGADIAIILGGWGPC